MGPVANNFLTVCSYPPITFLFSFGVRTAHLYISWRCPKPGVVACAGILAFLATGFHEVYAGQPLPKDAYVLLFGVSSATRYWVLVIESAAMQSCGSLTYQGCGNWTPV
jgi:hypothetical protein